jgi:hypothetical protein
MATLRSEIEKTIVYLRLEHGMPVPLIKQLPMEQFKWGIERVDELAGEDPL